MSIHQVCIPFEQVAAEKLGDSNIDNIRFPSRDATEETAAEEPASRVGFFRRRPETLLMAGLAVLAATTGVMVTLEFGSGLGTIVLAYFSGGLFVTGFAGLLRRFGNKATRTLPPVQDDRGRSAAGMERS